MTLSIGHGILGAMRNLARLLIIPGILLASALLIACNESSDTGDDNTPPEGSSGTFVPGGDSGAFVMSSSAWDVGEAIPQKYTCDGDNIVPPLTFTDIPEGTDNIAVIVEDPQTASGTFVHWVAWNLPLANVDEGAVPAGAVEGVNGAGGQGYTGPCPPEEHQYFFYAYALDAPLSLEAGATAADLRDAMEDHILAQTEYFGTYERP